MLSFYDFLQSNSLKNNFNEIKNYHEQFSEAERKAYKERKLDNILRFAVTESQYYKKKKLKCNLIDFPITDKQILKQNLQSILTQNTKGLKASSTSGSTGTPLVIYQDKVKAMRNVADFSYYYDRGNYEFGDKLYFLRAWENCKKNPLYLFLTNMVMQETKNLSDDNIALFLRRLASDKSKKSLWAYASSLTAITNYTAGEDLSDKINITSIFSGSEALPDLTKRRLIKTFKCPVYSRYSNQEMGLIAQQLSADSDLFTLNEASYYIEFLKTNSDKEAEPGEPSRIVLTDFFNTAMPLIRYDTGDIGIYTVVDGIRYLKSIEGRKTDFVYNTKGEPISPHAISMSMWEFKNIKQFQFIQEGATNYKIIINSSKPINSETIMDNIKKQVGGDAKIIIEYVDEIPVLSSGKRRYIVNNMKK